MPTTIIKTLSLLLVILSLTTACAHPYIEPTNGPQATLRFVSLMGSGPGDVFVHALTDEDCKARMQLIAALSGHEPTHHRKRLDMPLGEKYSDQDITEVKIQADKPFAFDFYWWVADLADGMNRCNVTTSFLPDDGHQYEAVYTLGRSDCSVDVFEIVKDDNGEYHREIELSAVRIGSQCKW